MRLSIPLSVKILIWFFLNLVILGLVFYVLAQSQFGLGLDSLVMGRAGDRIQVMTDVVSRELNNNSRSEWNDLLAQFSGLYHVKLVVVRNDGTQLAGENVSLPPEVMAKLREGRALPGRGSNPPGNREQGPPADAQLDPQQRPAARGPGGRLPPPGQLGPSPKFMLHTTKPSLYWVGVRARIIDRDHPGPMPTTLLAISDSIRGGGLFFDFVPWVVAGFGCVLVCVLFWLPLMRGITHSISQITTATEHIAEGRFDARVTTSRRDELGRLGQAINQMAARLSGFVTGQKRFLGDIAHELCSPIARIQMALGILEYRADEKQKAYVEDLREEIQEMSSLVNELLSFSRASLGTTAIKLQTVQLLPIAEKAVRREGRDEVEIRVEIDPSLKVLADPELLLRSLANLIRNAVRYAGHAGPIVLSAQRDGAHLLVRVADSGPGVPEESIAQLFDPFYRLEPSRNRETGGVGLGLAIVKTCVESCQGTVRCQNRRPSGLEVVVTLQSP
jgi:two-component system, OmpR family, sensor histidine kinase CpxA